MHKRELFIAQNASFATEIEGTEAMSKERKILFILQPLPVNRQTLQQTS